jgi:hypothetical protein
MHQGKVPNVTANEIQALNQIQALVRVALHADELTQDKYMRDVQWIVDTLLSGKGCASIGRSALK